MEEKQGKEQKGRVVKSRTRKNRDHICFSSLSSQLILRFVLRLVGRLVVWSIG